MARIFLAAIVMILGFGALLNGGIMLAAGIDPWICALVLVLGSPLAIGGLVLMLRFNRAYQDGHLAAVLADPSQIVARWQVGADEVILAYRGLFIGRAYHPFAAGYQTLQSMRFSADERRIHFEFSNIGADSSLSRELEVTPEVVATIREHLARVRPPGG